MINDIRFIFYTNENSFHMGEHCVNQFLKVVNNDNVKISLLSNKIPNVSLKFENRVSYINANVDFSMSGNHFAKTMLHMLSTIEEKYIFFFCDDYFIFKEPKYNELNSILELMNCEGIDFYCLDDIGADHDISNYKKYISNCPNPFHGHLYHRDSSYQHVFSVQASIWKREALFNILSKHTEISLHDFDNTLPYLREENNYINSICNDLNSYHNYIDDTEIDYHIVAYYEIVRHGVFFIKENNVGAPTNQKYVDFIYSFIENENLMSVPNFRKELHNYNNQLYAVNYTDAINYTDVVKKMRINIYYDPYNHNVPHVIVFEKLLQKIKETFVDIDFHFQNSNTFQKNKNYTGFGSKFGPHFMILENDDNKKYFVISYWDRIKDIVVFDNVTNWDGQNLVEIFTSAGVQKDDFFYEKLDVTYTPISYLTQLVSIEDYIEVLYNGRQERMYPSKLAFRGLLYQFRDYLSKDNRFNVIDKSNHFLNEKQYIEELSCSNLNFSINGAAEICNRDIEIFGLGTALFRTELNVKFHNKLIPNYHYISVNLDDINVKNFSEKFDFNGYWKELSDRVFDRFNEVKDDYDFINFVAKNGRKWYLENGTVDSNVNIIYNLLDFNKLK